MNKKLTIFLVANIPFSIGLWLLLILTVEPGSANTKGYPAISLEYSAIYLALNFAIDLAILGLMKILNLRSLFLTLLEITIFHLSLLYLLH